ncbi:hypothetical protein R5H30_02770 [Sulfitobacter sp. D35]|uniref:hypothetical protein n=1 Tax=Sulfitobacter sp. D35 TaxID=3083252 RepID=UPI00296FA95A|nr:hypothetical protein [Sulfitobacter sp. D35]MDW4496890.1 hypothetical protein [Sulfitobacter sp. D35]
MKPVLTLALALVIVAGCSANNRKQVFFDGQPFRTKLARGDERHMFTVTAKPVSASLTGARRAAEYQAIVYCVADYGSSDIRWTVGPDSASLPISDDTLTLQGACPQ